MGFFEALWRIACNCSRRFVCWRIRFGLRKYFVGAALFGIALAPIAAHVSDIRRQRAILEELRTVAYTNRRVGYLWEDTNDRSRMVVLALTEDAEDRHLSLAARLGGFTMLEMGENQRLTDSIAESLLQMKSLTRVSVRGCRIGDRTIEALSTLDSLIVADVSFTNATVVGMSALGASKSLRSVKLDDSQVMMFATDESFGDFAKQFEELEPAARI